MCDKRDEEREIEMGKNKSEFASKCVELIFYGEKEEKFHLISAVNMA